MLRDIKFGVIQLNIDLCLTGSHVPDSASDPSPPAVSVLYATAESRRSFTSVRNNASFLMQDSFASNFKNYHQLTTDKKNKSSIRLFTLIGHLTDNVFLRANSCDNLSFMKKYEQCFFTRSVTLEGGSGNFQPGIPVTPPDNTDPDENGYYFHDTFKGETFRRGGSGFA